MSLQSQTLLNTFGLEMLDIHTSVDLASKFVENPDVLRGMREFTGADADADTRKSAELRSNGSWLSTAGLAFLIGQQTASPGKCDSFESLLNHLLVQPPFYRDCADWWLFFTALAAGTRFQLERCTSHKTEPRLTGHLLEALASEGATWSRPLAPALARINARLAISEIDLEVGGGEQVSGGDFGLIIDFDGRTVQPSASASSDNSRIVPLIFQAKRFRRPMANVSQKHRQRGPQRDLLARNACSSAYIFYDNLGNPPTPLPPLVKPVTTVTNASQTNVLEGSLDFATYLLRTITDPACAPRATSPEEALRMIFSKAKPGGLCALVVISGDPSAATRYQKSVSMLHGFRKDLG